MGERGGETGEKVTGKERGDRIDNVIYKHNNVYRVRTGPGKPGKSWNLIIWIPGLESHGILDQVLESHGISCWQICMQQSCLRSRAAYCSGLSDMYAGKTLNYGNM